MKSILPTYSSFVALLFVLSVCSYSATSTSPLLRASRAADSDKTGNYIVVLRDETMHERFENIKSEVVSMTEDKEVHGSVETIVKAFTVKLSDDALSTVRSIPEVEYVEEETMARSAQDDGVIWHVDRLDQYYLPLDNSYKPNGTGDGVDIYILDGGVNYDHEEFEGRAEYGGYDPIDVAYNQSMRGDDCRGHGTHVASLAAGKTYGTAKKARIYSIRVLDCYGSGRWTTIIDGLDYVSRIIPKRGRPAVVSMSLSGPYSQTVDNAMKKLHNESIIVVAAAGNSFSNACYSSPAGSANVITVAGSDLDDNIYDLTNFGPCVDIFAPASIIVAADYICVSCSRNDSGTSMAAPKVSGVAAIHLEKDPTLTPDQMKTKLISTATPDVLNFSGLSSSYHLSTPNRLLYIGPSVSIDCEELPNITNGYVSVTGLTPGSVATYSCASGYDMKGQQNRTCNFLGKWSHNEPTCVVVCPDLTWNYTNGYLDYYYSNFYELIEGSIVYYSCYYGYSLVGDSFRVCQANGTWSGEEPTCVKATTCPDLTWNDTNGYLYGDPFYEHIEGSNVFYYCNRGYSLIGDWYRTCQANGTWSGEEPTCVITSRCPELTWNDTNGDLYYYLPFEGTNAYYYCDYGYFLLGDRFRICQANGTWSGEEPKCIAQCLRLSAITNGNITGHLGNRTEGTIVTYTCIDGYALVGSMQRICQSNRTWSGLKPSCVFVPPAPKVQALCSVVVWYTPQVPNCNTSITGYDVRLYANSPQSPEQNLTRRVGSNGTFYITTDEDNLGKGDETYVQVRAVSVDVVAGEWSEGISLGCDKPTVAPEISSVYFEFNNITYHNNSAICITAIGEAERALYCKTDKKDCCKNPPNRYGEFYYPNGERVPIRRRQHVFYRNRDEQLIRLNRRGGTISPAGKYRCEIPDASGEIKNIYINII